MSKESSQDKLAIMGLLKSNSEMAKRIGYFQAQADAAKSYREGGERGFLRWLNQNGTPSDPEDEVAA